MTLTQKFKICSNELAQFVKFAQVRSFFGLTHAGCTYLSFVLLVSLIAVRTGNNALYAFLTAMLSAIVVSSIISRNTLKQLALTLRTPDRLFAEKTVATRVSLTNTKRLFPSLAIIVEEMKTDMKNAQAKQHSAVFFPILRAGETRSARLEQTFPRRGLRRQTLQVATRFPFGFFLRRAPLPSQELLVYPVIGEIPEFLRTDLLRGRRESRRRGSGENFYSIREYQDGESARAIDWKATAKTRKLMAREYADDNEFHCLLILDTYVELRQKGVYAGIEKNDQAGELFEKAVSLAAGLVTRFIEDGALVEFLTPEIHIPANSGDRHLCRILETLAMIRLQTTVNLFCLDDSGIDGNYALGSPVVDLHKMISNQAFNVILTAFPEERFPAEIRHFTRIISFGSADMNE